MHEDVKMTFFQLTCLKVCDLCFSHFTELCSVFIDFSRMMWNCAWWSSELNQNIYGNLRLTELMQATKECYCSVYINILLFFFLSTRSDDTPRVGQGHPSDISLPLHGNLVWRKLILKGKIFAEFHVWHAVIHKGVFFLKFGLIKHLSLCHLINNVGTNTSKFNSLGKK